MLLEWLRIALWIIAAGFAVIVVMMIMNSRSAMKYIGHRVEMLPQAMLVRYGGMALLAVCAAWLGRPALLASTLLVFAVIGLGDAFIYYRARLPFKIHLVSGGVALALAILTQFTSAG